MLQTNRTGSGGSDDPVSPRRDQMRSLTGRALLTSTVILAMRASTLACKLGLAIFVGRYLDLSSLGLYALAAGAIALAPVVVGLGMVHVIMRDAVTLPPAQLTNNLRHYWYFTTSVYAIGLTLAVVVTFAADATWLWALVIAVALFEHFGNDVFQLLSNLERPLLANTNAFLRGAAWIVIYAPLALWHPSLRSLPILFGFWFAGSALAFLQFTYVSRPWPWKAAFALPLRRAWITATIKSAFIIYISDLSFVASQYLDRYLVTAFLGLRLAGVYFLYWSAANAVSTFVSIAVLQIERPRLIKAYHESGVRAHLLLVSGCMRVTALSSVAFSVVVGCAFYLVLPFLRQPAISDHLGAYWLTMAGMALRNVADVGAMGLFTARRDRLMTLTNVAAVIALVLVQATLLPIAGLYGPGAAILIVFAAIVLWRQRLLFGASTAQTP